MPKAVKRLAGRKAAGNVLLQQFYVLTYFLLGKNKSLRLAVFRKFLLVRLTTILAINMQSTIVSYFVYQLTYDPVTHKGDALVLGLLGLWEVIPAIGFSMFSGHFVDLAEKRRMMARCIAGYVLLTIFFIVLAWSSMQGVLPKQYIIWLVFAGIFIGGTLRAFFSPATFSLFGLLMPKKLYLNATTWNSAAWQAGFILGPLMAGGLIATVNFHGSLVVTAVIEVVALCTIMFIPAQAILKKHKEPIFKSLSEGIRFVFSTQIVLAALSIDMFAVLFGGAVALLPVYADEILKVGEIGFGWMRAAPGIGSMLMLFVLSAYPLKSKPGMKLLVAIAGFGVSTILFGICGDIAPTSFFGTFLGCRMSWAFVLAFFMLLAGGMFDTVSVVIRSTVLQLYTPDEMRGRVAAVNTMFISSSNELGAMESGVTARWMGTVPAVVFGGFMTMVVVGVTYFAAPLLRVVKLEPPEKKS